MRKSTKWSLSIGGILIMLLLFNNLCSGYLLLL